MGREETGRPLGDQFRQRQTSGTRDLQVPDARGAGTEGLPLPVHDERLARWSLLQGDKEPGVQGSGGVTARREENGQGQLPGLLEERVAWRQHRVLHGAPEP